MLPMSQGDCSRCHYPHRSGQICPEQLFEIPLCIKESDRWLGHLVLRYNTPDNDLNQQIAGCYRRDAKSQKFPFKFNILSDQLYIASGRFQPTSKIVANLGRQKTTTSGYDILEARLSTRSADILHWYCSSGVPSAQTLYIEEVFSRSRFGWCLAALGLFVTVGGGIFVYLRGSDSSTQNWLALGAIILVLVLSALGSQAR
jgi:hypothetical protein